MPYFLHLLYSWDAWTIVLLAAALEIKTRQSLSAQKQKIFFGLLLIPVICHFIFLVLEHYFHADLWDTFCFWLDSTVAHQGLNFYDPHSYQIQSLPLAADANFQREILNVGFRYPPPTMLLFYPLGYFSFSTAQLLWYGVNFLLAACIVHELAKQFLESDKDSFIWCSLLVLLFAPVDLTIELGQTNLITLWLLLLYNRKRNTIHGGMLIGAATFIKPYVLGVAIIPLFRRRIRVLIGIGLATVLAFALATIAFGSTTALAFFTTHTIQRIPRLVYLDPLSQSLFAWVFKIHAFWPAMNETQLFIECLVAVSAITALTAIAIIRNPEDELLVFSLAILWALLIYPHTLSHYLAQCLPAIAVLWRSKAKIWHPVLFTLLVFSYTFGALHDGILAVCSIAILWGSILWLAFTPQRSST